MKNEVKNLVKAAQFSPLKFKNVMAQLGRVEAINFLYQDYIKTGIISGDVRREIIHPVFKKTKMNGRTISNEDAMKEALIYQMCSLRRSLISMKLDLQNKDVSIEFVGYLGNSEEDLQEIYENVLAEVDKALDSTKVKEA